MGRHGHRDGLDGLQSTGPVGVGFIVDNPEGNTGLLADGAILCVLAAVAMIDRGLGTYIRPQPAAQPKVAR